MFIFSCHRFVSSFPTMCQHRGVSLNREREEKKTKKKNVRTYEQMKFVTHHFNAVPYAVRQCLITLGAYMHFMCRTLFYIYVVCFYTQTYVATRQIRACTFRRHEVFAACFFFPFFVPFSMVCEPMLHRDTDKEILFVFTRFHLCVVSHTFDG